MVLQMIPSFEGVLENKQRLGIPGKKLGVSWLSIADFCDAYLIAGEDEKIIDEKLSKAIILFQNQQYAEKLAKEKAAAEKLAKEKAAAEKLAKEKAAAEKLAKEKAAAEKEHLSNLLKNAEKRHIQKHIEKNQKIQKKDAKNMPVWAQYQEFPEKFDVYRFSVSSVLEFYTPQIVKEIMSIVIGFKGCHFKEWTNYWNAGSIMFDKNTMMIDVSFLKSDENRLTKIKVMKSFIRCKIKENAIKLVNIRTYEI